MPDLSRLPRRVAARAADRVAAAIARRLEERGVTAPPQPAPEDREARDNAHLELLLGFVLRADSNCIDVGCNRGRFLAHMVQRAPRGRHLAWEPLPELAADLREHFPGVEVHEAALSNENGETEFVVVPDDLGHSGLRERTYPAAWRTERIRVHTERLDDVLPEHYVPDFIKVDVEGAERLVFEGAIETIRRHRPVIVFEHGLGGSDHYGTTPEQVWDLLCGTARLRLFSLDADGPYSREEFAEVYAAARVWNFLARP
jgi:FkbM family methyltransferase